MKKSINPNILNVLLPVIIALLFNFPVTAQNSNVEKQVEKIQHNLNLSETQTTAIRQILIEEEEQKQKDRVTYQKDAVALISAAKERQNNTRKKIEPLLDESQLDEFKNSFKLHPVDRELFELTEGLLLTEEQVFDVEGILIQVYNEYGGIGERIEESGGMPSGPPPENTSRMEMPLGRGGGPNMDRIMKEGDAKKAKAIKKVLTDEQKEMFEQIRENRKQNMKNRIKEMKQKVNDREN